MLHGGECGMSVYISGEKEQIVIDNDVLTVLEIMGEIIEHEEMEWRKKLFREIKKGNKDVSIMMDTPMGRTKYYEAKKGFVDKIYQCCIFKGLVEYNDILQGENG